MGAYHDRADAKIRRCPVCEWCGHRDEGRFEWANLTGHYTDLTDYVRLCVSCHRRYDAKRRRETGQPTMGGGA